MLRFKRKEEGEKNLQEGSAPTASQKPGRDLLNGPIYPVLFSVSLPLILGNLILSLYNLADGLWLAQLSMLEFTATSFVWPPHYLFVSIGVGLSVAGTAIIAQLIGQKRLDQAELYASHLFWLSAGIGTSLSFIGYFLAPSIVRWMGADLELAEKSATYLSILLAGYIFEMVYLTFYAILAAQGQTRVTTTINIISALLNAVIDPIFIFKSIPFVGLPGLGMGIAGAALATILSQFSKVLMGIIAIRSSHNQVELKLRGVPLQAHAFSELIKTGFPTALGQSSAAVGFTILNSIIIAYGQATMTAFAAVNRISDFLMMPAQGIGTAMTPIIGQNLGADKKDRVRQFVGASMLSVTIIGIAAGLLQWFFRYPLLSLFLRDTSQAANSVWAQAVEYSAYSAVLTVTMGYFGLFSGIFNGSGYPRYSAYLSISRLWVVRIPMIFAFQRLTQMGSEAVWISMLASNVLIDLFGLALFLKGKWFREPKLRH